MYAHFSVLHMYFAADCALKWSHLNAKLRSILHSKMIVLGNAHRIAWITWMSRRNMKPYIMGSRSSMMTCSSIEMFDSNPSNNWSWVNPFFWILSPYSFIVHCSWILRGAYCHPLIFFAVSSFAKEMASVLTGYSFWDRLRNFLHKFTWIVLSVHKLNKLGKFW